MITETEQQLHQEIRTVYNSGDCKRAVELSIEFLRRFPKSYLARYSYAVMHGDYSAMPYVDETEKQRLLQIARLGLEELRNDPDYQTWPLDFRDRIRNEYAWFFEKHEDQYNLGIEKLERGDNGHYSACVGASMMAFKLLKDHRVKEAQEWARTSLHHFTEFEKVAPDWYNINYFAAQSLACLGKYDEALTCFKDMYRKQKSQEKPKEVDQFLEKLEEIRAWLER